MQIWGKNNKGVIQVPTEEKMRYIFFNSKFTPFHLIDLLGVIDKFLIEVLEKTGQIKNLKIDEGIFNDEPCYILDFIFVNEATYKGLKGKSFHKYILWLSKNKGFLPVKKIEILLADEKGERKNMEDITEITNIKKFDKEIWFPTRGKIESKLYNEDGTVRTHVLWEINLEDIEINKDIPDSFFEIKFPKGTKVYDETTGITYKVR